jgi:hypothetical protein
MIEPAGGLVFRNTSDAESNCEFGGGIIGGVLSQAAGVKQKNSARRTVR